MPGTSKDITLTKEEQNALIEIFKLCDKEDNEIRKTMVRNWKKLEEFWHGFQYLFWSDRDDSWRSPLDWNEDDTEATEELGSFSDKVIDIFKAHGESLISALSARLPACRFLPDNADDPNDVLTARTYNKIADLVQRHNKAKLVFLRALFFLCLNGIVASYRYKESDPKYGTYQIPKYDVKQQPVSTYTCETCGQTSDAPFSIEGCPQCGSQEAPTVTNTTEEIPVQTGTQTMPKTRAKVEVYGGLHFKVSYYARNQAECSYLILYGDLGKDIVKSTYWKFADEIESEHLENLDRFSRSEYNSLSVEPDVAQNPMVTVFKAWLRPAALWREKRKEMREKLLKKFPDGVKLTLIGKNKIFIEAVNESFDERWEIGQAGLSTYIYSDPILRPLVQIQEMRNQLVNLIHETISHGIPSDFADPAVVNFDTYGKFEAVPGYIYKTKPGRPGEPIGNSFYSTSRATLSREVGVFLQQLDKDAQFCIGDFPSVYGGPSEGKSRTYAEYAASRQMALQRLMIIWHFLTDWWLRTIEGLVKVYVETVTEDQHFTLSDSGNYINVWIRMSEMQGKVGGVEPEASETFPVSLAQMKDLIMKLMELNNEFVNTALYLPENARIIQDVLAMSEFKLPGEAQRVKQSLEIHELLREGPLDEMHSTKPIDPDIDDNAVHISTIKSWAVSPEGLDAKERNPQGYANVIAHLKEHNMALMTQMMSAQGGTPPGVPPETAKAGVEND